MLCDTFMYHLPGTKTVLLECDRLFATDLMKHLRKYLLRTPLRMENLTEKYSVRVTPQQTPGSSVIFGFNDPRSATMGFRSIIGFEGKRTIVPNGSLIQLAALDEAMEDTYRRMRIESCIAEGIQDIVPNVSLPLESNLDYMNGGWFRIMWLPRAKSNS